MAGPTTSAGRTEGGPVRESVGSPAWISEGGSLFPYVEILLLLVH